MQQLLGQLVGRGGCRVALAKPWHRLPSASLFAQHPCKHDHHGYGDLTVDLRTGRTRPLRNPRRP